MSALGPGGGGGGHKAQALTPVGGEVISVFQLLREWDWRKVTRKRHPGARLCHVPTYIALSDSGVRILGVDVLPLGSGGSLGVVRPLSDLSPLQPAFREGWLGGEHLIEQQQPARPGDKGEGLAAVCTLLPAPHPLPPRSERHLVAGSDSLLVQAGPPDPQGWFIAFPRLTGAMERGLWPGLQACPPGGSSCSGRLPGRMSRSLPCLVQGPALTEGFLPSVSWLVCRGAPSGDYCHVAQSSGGPTLHSGRLCYSEAGSALGMG